MQLRRFDTSQLYILSSSLWSHQNTGSNRNVLNQWSDRMLHQTVAVVVRSSGNLQSGAIGTSLFRNIYIHIYGSVNPPYFINVHFVYINL